MSNRVSIIIPTFNRATYLEQAINSARAQDYANLEILVTDNASDDETPQVVEGYRDDPRVVAIRNATNLGMVGNWHKALYEHISGDWFLILSDDDYLIDSGYISKAMALVEQQSTLNVVYANGGIKDEASGEVTELDLPFQPINRGVDVALMRRQVKPLDFTLCNVLFRTEPARQLNSFVDPNNVCCDSELFMKLAFRGDVGFVSDSVSVYRVHGNNLISRLASDFELFANNWEWLASVYRDVQEHSLVTAEQLQAFEDRVLVRCIREAVLLAIKHFPNRRAEVVAAMKESYGNSELVDRSQRHSKVYGKRLIGFFGIK